MGYRVGEIPLCIGCRQLLTLFYKGGLVRRR
jgi:hypothetical protein